MDWLAALWTEYSGVIIGGSAGLLLGVAGTLATHFGKNVVDHRLAHHRQRKVDKRDFRALKEGMPGLIAHLQGALRHNPHKRVFYVIEDFERKKTEEEWEVICSDDYENFTDKKDVLVNKTLVVYNTGGVHAMQMVAPRFRLNERFVSMLKQHK